MFAQLVEHCSSIAEVMGSNYEVFSGLIFTIAFNFEYCFHIHFNFSVVVSPTDIVIDTVSVPVTVNIVTVNARLSWMQEVVVLIKKCRGSAVAELSCFSLADNILRFTESNALLKAIVNERIVKVLIYMVLNRQQGICADISSPVRKLRVGLGFVSMARTIVIIHLSLRHARKSHVIIFSKNYDILTRQSSVSEHI